MKREKQISLANNYTIENFSEDHIDQVYAIELYSNPTPWSKKIFHKILESRSLSFVIKLEDQVIGFCMANRVLDECHLQNITVAKEYRRQGLGQFMMDILIKRMRLADLNSVLLEVRKSNHAAQSFYEKSDFERLSERKDYYKTENGKENAIIMHRILR